MATEIIMPKVDMVMESGTFVEWLRNEGEHVEKGQPLFVIMTDKAAIEIEAPASGILSDLRAQPDEVIPVTQTIAYILEPGEKAPTSAPLIAPAGNGGEVQPSTEGPMPTLTAVALASAQPDVLPGKVRATPVARRMAAQLGVDLLVVQGRGPKGRVHKADVMSAAEQKALPPVELPSVEIVAPARSVPAPSQAFPGLSIPLPDARQKLVVPLTGPRKIIAERMAYSAHVAPHITLTVSVDMTEAARLRSRLQKSLEEKTGYRLSFTTIIVRVVAAVLHNHPFLNASLAGDQIIAWEDVHLGIATNLEDYLVVPVIREAQTKTLEQLLTSLGDLLERARSRKLAPSEMSGSTFTISNMGMYGIESFTAIINPPESAILAVGSIVDTYVKVDQEMIEKPMMKLTICADHRVVDGVAAANFLNEVKSILENPYFLI
jgi:pyruvate dehydrogenase E2 component (dihydrolipoamide acetyltransferase)